MTRLAVSVLAASCFAAAPPTIGTASAQPGAGGSANVEAVPLQPEAFEVKAMGLKLYLPAESGAQTEFVADGPARTTIQPPSGRWVIQIVQSRSTDHELTTAQAMDAVVRQHEASIRFPSSDPRQAVTLLEPFDRVDDLRVGGHAATRAYMRPKPRFADFDTPDGPLEQTYPRTGYTIVRTEPGEFVTFQLDAAPQEFERARAIYETVIAAAEFDDPQAEADERRSILTAGRLFMEDVTPEDLDAALYDEPLWLRVYRPATSGGPEDAEELGYQRVEVRIGQRGELNPSLPKNRWDVEHREYGWLVLIEARMQTDGLARDGYIDSRAAFWLSRDRQREFWRVTLDIYKPEQDDPRGLVRTRERSKSMQLVRRAVQTLVRHGPTIQVRSDVPGGAPERAEFTAPRAHYLSAVERYLLPRVVAQSTEDQAALYDLGFYTFDGARSALSLRRDTFRTEPGGGWTQTTRAREDALPWTTTLDDAGRMITQTLPPDRLLERTSEERLEQLWLNKRQDRRGR